MTQTHPNFTALVRRIEKVYRETRDVIKCERMMAEYDGPRVIVVRKEFSEAQISAAASTPQDRGEE